MERERETATLKISLHDFTTRASMEKYSPLINERIYIKTLPSFLQPSFLFGA